MYLIFKMNRFSIHFLLLYMHLLLGLRLLSEALLHNGILLLARWHQPGSIGFDMKTVHPLHMVTAKPEWPVATQQLGLHGAGTDGQLCIAHGTFEALVVNFREVIKLKEQLTHWCACQPQISRTASLLSRKYRTLGWAIRRCQSSTTF